jgi:hypothetical protein
MKQESSDSPKAVTCAVSDKRAASVKLPFLPSGFHTFYVLRFIADQVLPTIE